MTVKPLYTMVYFYFDFRDIDKQHWRHLITSILTQLSSNLSPHCDILSRLYSEHDDSAQPEQPGNDTLTGCLMEMLTLPNQCPIYLIINALMNVPMLWGSHDSHHIVIE